MSGWFVNYLVDGRLCDQHAFRLGNGSDIRQNRSRIAYLYGLRNEDVKIEGVFYLNGTAIESQPI